MTAETSNARGELRMADIREDAREPLQLLREKLAHDEDGWAALCQLMPMLAAAPPPAAARGDVRGLVAKCRAEADAAYVAYIRKMDTDECRGWEAKVRDGTFARANLDAFTAAAELLGRHRALHAFASQLESALAAEGEQAEGAEAKTLPVPTRVHLIGETAVIVGTPGRGWDEDGPDAHNCDAMGCATIGPHVLARVPFTDERALSQQPAAVDEAMVDRACDAYVQIADDCMGLVRRKAMRAALTVALGDVRRLVAKLAAHVRPTCSELWDEAQAFLAVEGVQPEARGVVDGWRLVVRYGEYDSEPGVWAEKDGSLVWIAALTAQHQEPKS